METGLEQELVGKGYRHEKGKKKNRTRCDVKNKTKSNCYRECCWTTIVRSSITCKS